MMPRSSFRFRPPPVPRSPELTAALALAFGPADGIPPSADLDTAFDLAAGLGLLPRVATRAVAARLASAGEHFADRLRRERTLAIATELRLDHTLAEVAEAAAALGTELVLLKGRALSLAGYSAPGARPSGDIDLLTPPAAISKLSRALVARGFQEAPGDYEHHPPTLHQPGGMNVELHRHVPGVRFGSGRASADWPTLVGAGLLLPLPDGAGHWQLQVPAREVLIAHAIVHGLAQHGLHAVFPGWRVICDLVDLRATRVADDGWRRWITRDVSEREIDAALALARLVEHGGDPLDDGTPDDIRALAAHFVASAFDPEYGESLKARWLEAPLSELPRPLARARVLARALAPPPVTPTGRRVADTLSSVGRWLARPLVLATRIARSLRAGRSARSQRSNSG